jgi:hypothetical protein
MSTYLDLETDRFYDDDECREHADWMTIGFDHGHVSIKRENLTRLGQRRVDPASGISFRAEHLDAVIDALVRVRADLPMVPSRLGEESK